MSKECSLMAMRCTRGDVNTRKPGYVPARVLWPALGFPAVIVPGDSSETDNASTCVTVLILSPAASLTKKQASDHLRFVPWEQRRTRYLPAGAANGFLESEIEIRPNPGSDGPGSRLKSNEFVQQVYFGYDATLQNGFTVGLSAYVLAQYRDWKYPNLYEIRISRAASSRLTAGQYNLFWINEDFEDTEKDISHELDLLIQKYAKKTRDGVADSLEDDDAAAKTLNENLLMEYEYDYLALNSPYTSQKLIEPAWRTEVLHPLFVQDAAKSAIRIGHVTDLHVATRNDSYEEALTQGVTIWGGEDLHEDDELTSWPSHHETIDFNNWNKSSFALYAKAKKSCDVLLLTGDLIDYGRGAAGGRDTLGEDSYYLQDRNWFLFYSLFASGTSYEKPAYTILGNHDWRINPYPPFAPGAPDPRSMINDYPRIQGEVKDKDGQKEADRKLKWIIRMAHGAGYDKQVSYYYNATGKLDWYKEDNNAAWHVIWQLMKNSKTLNIEHLPTQTVVESVSWYLLLINPFLDYSFHLAGGYDMLMLDWAKYEDVLFPIIENGKERPYSLVEAEQATDPGPMAKACLTDLQKGMAEAFAKKPGKAKVLGIHAPPIGAYTSWTDDLLYQGLLRDTITNQAVGEPVRQNVHSWQVTRRVLAVLPKGAAPGHRADYNSFVSNRDWLIQRLRDKDANVRLVLGGHIHRSGLFVVHTPYPGTTPSVTPDELQTNLVTPDKVKGAIPPAVTQAPHSDLGPLYVNTTSAGPRGHSFAQAKKFKEEPDVYIDPGYAEMILGNDGTIQMFAFLDAKSAAPTV
ncbi:MAG TPA: metallophosphoesterase [Bryobacteraceae bacterium]|jgi:hypothetical protein